MSDTRMGSARKRGVAAGVLLIGCVLLPGCGRSNPEPPDVLKAQREAMEKAKATEKVMQDSAEHRDAQLESQAK
jgi:hypothetical protein